MFTIKEASPESKTIQQFFDSIAFRYDFLNRILSFQMDDGWRKKSMRLILDQPYEKLLDLGMGTGKFSEVFLKEKNWKRSVGLDFSSSMLEAAREQFHSRSEEKKIGMGNASGFAEFEYVSGDFLNLPFENESFDLIISAFTLRSVKNMTVFLKEIKRVLSRGGKAAFLCLTRPENPIFKLIYYPYLKIYLPLVGGLLSGNRRAYQFLADSILSFQEPEKTAQAMTAVGFSDVQIHKFTFGSATLIMGKIS